MQKHAIRLGILFMVMVFVSAAFPPAAHASVLKTGSSGGDVWDLQYRLKVLGYYDEPLDGIYGTVTRTAVKRYQADYGLRADGIVGSTTWKSLKLRSLNRQEYEMMAKIIYSEARGEPYTGQVAVGAVVMNRILSPLFPNTINGVVFQARAFTAVDDGQYWMTPNRTAYMAALDAVRGWDPSGNALYYFNPDTATSKWIWTRPQIKKIGNHIFTH